MDFVELIKSRRTIREFSDRAPNRKLIEHCLEAAIWAPNPVNQQPWKFYVVTGTKLAEMNDRFEATFFENAQAAGMDEEIQPDCEARKDETMRTIARVVEESGSGSGTFVEKMVRFFDAPVVVLFTHYRSVGESYKYGTAAALQNFLLAAHSRGLGACWLGVARMCQEELRPILSIAPELEVLGGVGIGYPAEKSALNSFNRSRTPCDEQTVWCGFDPVK
jgi:nitroreductase